MPDTSTPSTPRRLLLRTLAALLCVFVLVEVNYPNLRPESRLAIFAGLGLIACFLLYPIHPNFRDRLWSKVLDAVLSVLTAATSGWIVVQNEPNFERFWLGGLALGDRAGAELPIDFVVGTVGLVVILEATRRVVGPALPILSVAFLAYARFGPSMPGWLFPHRGYGLERTVAQTFLHSQGVFGIALRVMFTYVFLFVVFGAFLELTGATAFIISWTQRLFRGSAGGPAKVAVLSSGLMGSLSGSAVANTATTGTFTIPLMRSSGFRAHTAGGIEAAASSGGALMPPVMGAGAYMMLEIIDPPVTYLEVIRAALLPALLYYLSLFLIVHFRARLLVDRGKLGGGPDRKDDQPGAGPVPGAPSAGRVPGRPEGAIFFAGLGSLIAFLLAGSTVFRAVSLAMAVIVLLSFVSRRTRLTPRRLLDTCERATRAGVSLVAAAASVGIVLGVVTLTGIGSKLPAAIIPLAESNLFLALLLIMVSSIILGMGLPSAVCYLLLATVIGPALGDLGVLPLAAHLFIFYFGLMSMVTPPVALAAYTAASIADSSIMRTALAAFRFALIGFVLPFLFIYRPQLLMLGAGGGTAPTVEIVLAVGLAALGIVPLAAAMAGHLRRPLGAASRGALLVAAALLFVPARPAFLPDTFGELPLTWLNLAGAVVLFAITALLRPTDRDSSEDPDVRPTTDP